MSKQNQGAYLVYKNLLNIPISSKTFIQEQKHEI